jgi:hypothetical protein
MKNKSTVMGTNEMMTLVAADSSDTIIIDRDIVCTEYAPDIFAHLRHLDGYDNESLMESLNPELEANIQRIFKSGEGMGKSGSFFFFCHDERFLIKTMTKGDFKAF